MPRPASPFNWTVAVFDGRDYHLAHINTRREAPLVAGPQDFFVRRFSAPYQPVAQATWARVPRFGGEGTPVWVLDAWGHEAFATFRWFAQVPALIEAGSGAAMGGAAAGSAASAQTPASAADPSVAANAAPGERCAVFRDLRFEFPGRDRSPFRYAVCLGDAGTARVFSVGENGWRPI
jgi:inner membrane protein